MAVRKRHLYIIAGPNGAGKTTSALKLLPDFLHCEEYVNADSIAAGLSQFKPETVAINAGRMMLTRIQELYQRKQSFAFETTLASRSFATFIKKCRQAGYSSHIIFLWLQSPDLAIKRVEIRVKNGGHSIPKDIIRRRYIKGVINFFKLYLPVVDNWTLYDNSSSTPVLIAKKYGRNKVEIIHESIWQKIMEVIA